MVCFAVKTTATVAKNVAQRAMRVKCKVNSEDAARKPNNEQKLTLKLHEGETVCNSLTVAVKAFVFFFVAIPLSLFLPPFSLTSSCFRACVCVCVCVCVGGGHGSSSGVEAAFCYRNVAGSIPQFCMSECPWARHWTPNGAGRHLAWQPPPSVYECMYELL